MLPAAAKMDRSDALAALREQLGKRHFEASEAAFVPADDRAIRSGIPALDRATGGGFARGLISTLEGQGSATLAARLFAEATEKGLAALIEAPATGRLAPAALRAAGVRLERLLLVKAEGERDVARAADIVLRSNAFTVVALPAVPLRAPEWTRLASLAHRADAVLLTLGSAPSDLRYFASLRLGLRLTGARFLPGSGVFSSLAGFECEATVLKHKRFAPGRTARFSCITFEREGAPVLATREQRVEEHVDRLRVRAVV
jgi:recombination protein RecA